MVGGLLGAIAVAAGAFGAHVLRERVDAHAIEIWQTGCHYLLAHAIVLLAIGLAGGRRSRFRDASTWLLSCGAILFAGTLFAIALGAPTWLGAITPVGGLGMIGGWCALVLHARELARPGDDRTAST